MNPALLFFLHFIEELLFGSKSRLQVSIEGNIGCGKSTLLNYFRNRLPSVRIIDEPLSLWKNLANHNLLDMMYSDPKRWSTMFQSYAMLTIWDSFMGGQPQQQQQAVILRERSLESAFKVFSQNSHRQGLICDMDFHILSQWYRQFKEEDSFHLDLIVYLRAEPAICMRRVQLRSREEEQALPVELMEQLHSLHDEWLIEGKFGKSADRILVIDTDKELSELTAEYDKKLLPILNQGAATAAAAAAIAAAPAAEMPLRELQTGTV